MGASDKVRKLPAGAGVIAASSSSDSTPSLCLSCASVKLLWRRRFSDSWRASWTLTLPKKALATSRLRCCHL